MAKTVILVRHGQAEHNVTGNLTLRDPALTDLGKRQARLLDVSPMLAGVEVDLVVASPLTRCLETAELAFGARAGSRPAFIAHPDAQETGAHPSDTGVERDELEARGFGRSFDLALCTPGWHAKAAPFDPASGALLPAGCAQLRERLARLGAWLLARPEARIALVSHHGVFGHLPGLDLELSNCEVVVAALNARGWTVRRASDELVLVLDGHGRQVTNYFGEKLSATIATIRIVHGKGAAAISQRSQAAGREGAGISVQAAATVEAGGADDADASKPPPPPPVALRPWRTKALVLATLVAVSVIVTAAGVMSSQRRSSASAGPQSDPR